MALSEMVIGATLQPDGTLVLDNVPNIAPGRVQVTVRTFTDLANDDPLRNRIEAMWDSQKKRGQMARTEEEVERDRKQVREEWDARMQRMEQVRVEANEILKLRAPRP